MRGSANVLPGHVGQLVSVLTRRGHTDGSGPIVVHMSHLIREPLHVIGRQRHIVVNAHEVRGRHGSLTHVLGDEEEVVVVALRDRVVHHRPGRRIIQSLRSLHEEFGVDTLLHDDYGQFGSASIEMY